MNCGCFESALDLLIRTAVVTLDSITKGITGSISCHLVECTTSILK